MSFELALFAANKPVRFLNGLVCLESLDYM